MAYVRIETSVLNHRKFAGLTVTAFGIWVQALLIAGSSWQSDGFVSASSLRATAGIRGGNFSRYTRELESAGLFEPGEGGWQIHDWQEWNRSAAQVRASRGGPSRRRVRDELGTS